VFAVVIHVAASVRVSSDDVVKFSLGGIQRFKTSRRHGRAARTLRDAELDAKRRGTTPDVRLQMTPRVARFPNGA
jgi:hypothetical protein